MVGLVRDDGMNPDELASRMEELQKTLQPTEHPSYSLPDLQPASTNRAMNVSYLTSTSPIEVKAKPWTKVAEDSMVSHLISIFMTWELPFFPMIDRQRFLADFVAANTQTASGCSPLLVNAMCARACVCLSLSLCHILYPTALRLYSIFQTTLPNTTAALAVLPWRISSSKKQDDTWTQRHGGRLLTVSRPCISCTFVNATKAAIDQPSSTVYPPLRCTSNLASVGLFRMNRAFRTTKKPTWTGGLHLRPRGDVS